MAFWFLRRPAVVRAFFLGSDGRVPWGAWLVPGLAWLVLLAALFLVGHCGMILMRRQWIDNERLAFPLAQIPLGLTTVGADGWTPVLRAPVFWMGLALPMSLGMLNGLHRYAPAVPDLPLRPLLQYDFAAHATPPWTGLGLLELRLSPWLIGIVALLPAEISLSGWVFFWVTKMEDVSALYFGATDLPSVYSNQYPALYAQGAGAAYALAALALWASRRHLGRMIRAAWKPGRGGYPPRRPVRRVRFAPLCRPGPPLWGGSDDRLAVAGRHAAVGGRAARAADPGLLRHLRPYPRRGRPEHGRHPLAQDVGRGDAHAHRLEGASPGGPDRAVQRPLALLRPLDRRCDGLPARELQDCRRGRLSRPHDRRRAPHGRAAGAAAGIRVDTAHLLWQRVPPDADWPPAAQHGRQPGLLVLCQSE